MEFEHTCTSRLDLLGLQQQLRCHIHFVTATSAFCKTGKGILIIVLSRLKDLPNHALVVTVPSRSTMPVVLWTRYSDQQGCNLRPLSSSVKAIHDIPESTRNGLANLGEMFGIGNSKGCLDAAFGTGNGARGQNDNVLFGTNGVISRTLTYWESVIRDLFDLVDQLRAELFRMREEMERARDEWKRQREEMEGEKRAAEQMAQAQAAAADQKASGLQDRLTAAQAVFRTAEASHKFGKHLLCSVP